MLTKYHTLPEWLRWALLLPLTIATTGAVLWIVAWFAGPHYFLIRQAAAIASFMLIIQALVPRWQNRIALTVLLGRMLIFIAVIVIVLARGNPMAALWTDIERELIGWVTGWVLFFVIKNRTRPSGP